MISQIDLLNFLNTTLGTALNDYAPNGLQVEGKSQIQRLAYAVSASEQVIKQAIEHKADALLVHHGLYWKGNWHTIEGRFGRKIKECLKAELNVLAYHLPLDAHLEFGNAISLANKLDIINCEAFAFLDKLNLGIKGKLTINKADFLDKITALNNKASVIDFSESFDSVAIVTGAGQHEFQKAINEGIDVFITGESSEWVYHMAREEKKMYIALGHHVSEKFGVEALAGELNKRFKLETFFIDEENPF
jgi:dinuclear metal center YbgI/SA1388 family protein